MTREEGDVTREEEHGGAQDAGMQRGRRDRGD